MGWTMHFCGPLILGYKGKEEIHLSQNAEFELKGNKKFSLRNDTLQFIPVYHLLNPEVKKDLGYQVQVIFKNE